MTVIDKLKETLTAVQSLEDDIIGPDAAKAEVAEKRYLQLLNRFYEENEDLMAVQQYEAAK